MDWWRFSADNPDSKKKKTPGDTVTMKFLSRSSTKFPQKIEEKNPLGLLAGGKEKEPIMKYTRALSLTRPVLRRN